MSCQARCIENSLTWVNPKAPIHFKPGLITEDGQVIEERVANFLPLNEVQVFIVQVLTVLPSRFGVSPLPGKLAYQNQIQLWKKYFRTDFRPLYCSAALSLMTPSRRMM